MKIKRCKECKRKLKDKRKILCIDCDFKKFELNSGVKMFNMGENETNH